MSSLFDFEEEVKRISDRDSLIDFCRRKIIHGTPFVFKDKEDNYYYFLKQISDKFLVPFNQIHICGSAKLGFSYIKKTEFSYNSDIDVTIISQSLFDEIMYIVGDFQMDLNKSVSFLTENQQQYYFKFLKYSSMGWIRPDLLPIKSYPLEFRKDWFDFFQSISYKKCTAGDYKVAAGVFRSYQCFERYTLSGLDNLVRL